MASGTEPIIWIKSPEEITGREHYVARILPDNTKPTAILGKYSFSQQNAIRCGICGTKHMHGYLIRTNTGVETNIGHECGEHIFGIAFDEVKAEFKLKEQKEIRRQTIDNFLNNREQIINQGKQLTSEVGHAIDQITGLWNFLHSEPGLTNSLRDIIRNAGKIQLNRKIDEKVRKLAGFKDQNILETVATLEGIDAFHGGDTIRSKLNVFSIGDLKNLNRDAVEQLTDKDILKLAEYIRAARDAISDAQHYLANVQILFSPTNQKKLALMEPSDGKITDRTRRKLQHFEKLSQRQ